MIAGMKRILLTGARAPATLDLARRFHRYGHQVFLCDTLRFPLTRFTRRKASYFRIPPPQNDTDGSIRAINRIVADERIDLVIPTCEECFYLSLHQKRIATTVFVDSMPLMDQLHNKFLFSLSFGNEHASAPNTRLLESNDQLKQLQLPSNEFVFKPVYSRFATQTLISPTDRELNKLKIQPDSPWVAQQRIFGREFSSYAIAANGNLLAWSSYCSPYRAGPGAGIFFQPATHGSILPFLKTFLLQTSYTGQIGFDFIVDSEDRLWVIEANPRSTSGIHLLPERERIVDCFFDATTLGHSPCTTDNTADQTPKMIAGAMMLWGTAHSIGNLAFKRFLLDSLVAKDVLFQCGDPLPCLALPLSFGELIWSAVTNRQSLQAASTSGVEWNWSCKSVH
jgi:hypothetical protein